MNNFDPYILDHERKLKAFKESRSDYDEKIIEYSSKEIPLSDRLKSDGKSTFREFIDNVINVWNMMSDSETPVPIVREKPRDKEIFETATITYSLVKRNVLPERNEVKPRFREAIKDPHREGEFIEIYGQTFDYYTKFTINSISAEEADDLVEEFEEFLLRYSGFFKRCGVTEILFIEQQADMSTLNSHIEVNERPLIFKIRLERLSIRSLNDIEQIGLQANIYKK